MIPLHLNRGEMVYDITGHLACITAAFPVRVDAASWTRRAATQALKNDLWQSRGQPRLKNFRVRGRVDGEQL